MKISVDLWIVMVAEIYTFLHGRLERFRNFEKYLDKYPEWKKQVSFHVFKGIGHKEDLAYPAKEILDFIFER